MRLTKYILTTIFMQALFSTAIANTYIDTTYTYYDGVSNKYILSSNKLEYTPVQANESSSGIYNGGSYTSKVLTEYDCLKLEQLFNNALANKKAHTIKNVKPNAAIEISVGNKKINFLLKSAAAINISLNNFLKQLIIK